MSEFQYYEWQVVDRPLTPIQQEAVGGLSSHISVTPHRAQVDYSWGDFKYDPITVLGDYFDAFLYMANWGHHRLAFRFPEGTIDERAIAAYENGDFIVVHHTIYSIIVELNTSESELARGWIEGEGWLSRLLPLRAEILKGDYRSLYLFRCWADEQLAAWWDEEEDGPMSPLPPAPSGLGRLSMAQQALVNWLDIDEAIIARARAHRAEAAVDASYDYDALIRALPREESDAFLRRLLDDEPLLSAALRQRLRRG
ncbi:MAG: hypothetical protein KDD73_01165 [Anaerolineales bacterium]|nr:hypothetical protein [Anaerolineales bacterium]